MINGAGSAALMLIFLIALVLISRLRSVVSAEYRSELNLIAGGITVLAICELLVGLERSSSLTAVPFLSDALFHELTVWIGIITGSILTVSGMARWTPLIRKLKESGDRNNDNSLLMRLEQISQVEHRPNELFKLAFESITDHYRLEQAIGLLYSNSDKRFYPLITRGGNSGEFLHRIELVAAEFERSSRIKAHAAVSLQESDRFVHAFAIHAAGKLCGVYLLWTEGEKLERPAVKQIRTICEIIGRVIDRSRLRLTVNHRTVAESLRNDLRKVSESSGELARFVTKLGASLRNSFSSDYVSLSLLDNTDRLERLSVGRNGSLLKENGLEAEKYVSEAATLFGRNKALLISDTNGFAVKEYSRVLVNSGMRSIMAVRLEQNDVMLGVLLVASHRALKFSRIDLSLLDSLSTTVGRRLELELSEREKQNALNMQRRVNRFMTQTNDQMAGLDRYQEAANCISDNMNVDLVRIALLDETGTRLTTRSHVTRRRLKEAGQANSTYTLDQLPMHRKVIDSGDSLIMPDRIPALSDIEESFLFSGLKGLLIVPILSSGNVIGTISVAHGRKISVGRSEVELQLELIASLLGQTAGEITATPTTLSSGRPNLVNRINRERHEQVVRSSLSGILGSLEMINGGSVLDETKRKRFLEIIDRSARKLERSLELTN